VTRSEVAVNTVRAPVSLRLVSGVGWAEAPLLTAPVGVRSSAKDLVLLDICNWDSGARAEGA
jgi:hypothetical protein